MEMFLVMRPRLNSGSLGVFIIKRDPQMPFREREREKYYLQSQLEIRNFGKEQT